LPKIESPCNRVCTLDPAIGLCIGCGRTLAEITGWTGLTPAERRQIMAQLGTRLVAHRVFSSKADTGSRDGNATDRQWPHPDHADVT
jgi:predicted Fe-S protein YdhL (DUF1289 family)